MNSENVVKHLRALWRTDRIIAEIRMRHMLVGFGLRAFAALIAAFGLLMLELSAYFALVQIWSAISAAAILGVANFVIAAVLFVVGGRPPAGRELELATEIHGSAIEALAGRGPRAAIAIHRHGPASPEQRAAVGAGAADHDHRQEPEEIREPTATRQTPPASRADRGEAAASYRKSRSHTKCPRPEPRPSRSRS